MAIKLNGQAHEYAQNLIEEGRYVLQASREAAGQATREGGRPVS